MKFGRTSVLMKIKSLILSGCLLMLNSCFSGKAIEYQKIKGLHPEKIGKESVLLMDVEFYNPNSWGCTLTSMTSEIRFDNRLLGSCELTKPVLLQPKHSQIWPCKLNVTTIELIKSLPAGLEIILGDKKVNANIKGNIRIKKWIFSKNYKFDVNQQIDGQWLKNLY